MLKITIKHVWTSWFFHLMKCKQSSFSPETAQTTNVVQCWKIYLALPLGSLSSGVGTRACVPSWTAVILSLGVSNSSRMSSSLNQGTYTPDCTGEHKSITDGVEAGLQSSWVFGADDSGSEQTVIWESAPNRSHGALSFRVVFERFFKDNLDGRFEEGELVPTLKFIVDSRLWE